MIAIEKIADYIQKEDNRYKVQFISVMKRFKGDFQLEDSNHILWLCANLIAENGKSLIPAEENLSYSLERFKIIFPNKPYTRDKKKLAETIYGGRLGNVNKGDGWLFRGRGYIQLTGRYNYRKADEVIYKRTGLKFDLEFFPDTLTNATISTFALLAFYNIRLRGCKSFGCFVERITGSRWDYSRRIRILRKMKSYLNSYTVR